VVGGAGVVTDPDAAADPERDLGESSLPEVETFFLLDSCGLRQK